MKTTGTILDEIVAAKRQSLERRKRQKPQVELEQATASLTPFSGPTFFEALKTERLQPKIIAEVKRASPSAGVLRKPFMADEINQAYQTAGAVVAISIITEENFFQGSDETLKFFAEHNAHQKPLLRKDFIFDSYQILESKALGAQAYLLIASLFDLAELRDLVDFSLALEIEPLVEVHTAEELKIVRQTAARCIGVNSRDLRDFSVTTDTHELLKDLPAAYARIAESGIDSPEGLSAAMVYADAALIGSQFMRAPDISAAIEQLTGAGSTV